MATPTHPEIHGSSPVPATRARTSPLAIGAAGLSCLVPLEVLRLQLQHAEGPFGNGLAIVAVFMLGVGLAIVYAIVAVVKIRTRRGGAAAWIAGAAIALSPALYFFVWNTMFRTN